MCSVIPVLRIVQPTNLPLGCKASPTETAPGAPTIVRKPGACVRRAVGERLAIIGQVGTYLFFLGAVCLSLSIHAPSQVSPQTRKAQIGAQEPLRTAQASRVDRAPKIDGTLDDPI